MNLSVQGERIEELASELITVYTSGQLASFQNAYEMRLKDRAGNVVSIGAGARVFLTVDGWVERVE